ncbi:hypothetical protein L249_1430 [Ophiocordyceps polyrhachis-furcata BCC 54312]|uniref:U3 small nucleolar RNA-associated protein 25 n=1 Tax=Ophiocordyceps polyrhachis-furcata BCC 54312 TaxID=1330021 RepID=A0A367L4G7_9HYPO|nr:hypothetical protein L249_1430 [Ophiocordyceps polyrhachis-furcata BCC 54312]
MNPRGRGGKPRGRGFRGRGRSRGSSRFGPSRQFHGGRLADKEVPEEPDVRNESEGAIDDEAESIASDEEEDTQLSHPYQALLRSFHDAAAPEAKRRKLDHDVPTEKTSDPLPPRDEEPSAEENDDVDRVGEEEDEEEGIDDHPYDVSDSENEDDSPDPFDVHFAHPDEASVQKAIEDVVQGRWATKRALIQPLRATLLSPGSEASFSAPHPASRIDSFRLKQKLKQIAAKQLGELDESQRVLAPLLFDYRDVLHCHRTVANSDGLRRLVCLHALNHLFKTRDRVLKNNSRLAKEGEDTELELRDQGFTRPKVLFLLPTRNSCARMMYAIQGLCEAEQLENRKRFEASYVDKSSSFRDDRPTDFVDLFGGNDDDMFRIGVKFTRKTIKYFSPFYGSDILLASPLGLRMAMGSEGDKKKPDSDFLSSIEMIIVDQADALLMQNWDHVEHIFEHLNRQPADAHGCDFSRLRSWYLDDQAKFYRQTVVLSAFNTPELSELLRQHCHNWAGKARLQPEYSGVMQQLGIKAKQTFSRFLPASVEQEPDARFEYFVSAVVPRLVRLAKYSSGTLLFIPSYLDFVRVRNYFANSTAVSSVTFGAISEYSEVPDASRACSHFASGRHRLLLYTERAHHFRRYRIRGVQGVVFYGLPDNPVFYREVAGEFLSRSQQELGVEATVRVMFSRFDAMKLERVVGSSRVAKMLQERGDTFDFY